MGEGEGLKGKIAPFFLLPTQNRGGGALDAGGGPGHGGGRGKGEKGERAPGSRFPSPISEEGARKEGCHGGGRRPVLAGAAATLQGLAAAGARGKGRGNLGDSIPLTTSGWGGMWRRLDGGGRTAGSGAVAAAQRAR